MPATKANNMDINGVLYIRYGSMANHLVVKILPLWIKGEGNPADLLTKGVAKGTVEQLHVRELLHGIKEMATWTTRKASEITKDKEVAQARYAVCMVMIWRILCQLH